MPASIKMNEKPVCRGYSERKFAWEIRISLWNMLSCNSATMKLDRLPLVVVHFDGAAESDFQDIGCGVGIDDRGDRPDLPGRRVGPPTMGTSSYNSLYSSSQGLAFFLSGVSPSPVEAEAAAPDEAIGDAQHEGLIGLKRFKQLVSSPGCTRQA